MSANPPPKLIVVTGRPGSGKTTLAHLLARSIRCPAICRDEIKEGLANTAVDSDPPAGDLALRAYEAFFDTIGLLLRHHVTVVAEAAFQHKRWEPRLTPLLPSVRMRIVVCHIDPQLAQAREVARAAADPQRLLFHPLTASAATTSPSIYDPLRLDVPTLQVDTTDGYRPQLEDIIAFLRS